MNIKTLVIMLYSSDPGYMLQHVIISTDHCSKLESSDEQEGNMLL